MSGSKEQKKLRRTENSGWLLCAAVLDCSHLLLIVAIGIAHVMQHNARLTLHNAVLSSSNNNNNIIIIIIFVLYSAV